MAKDVVLFEHNEKAYEALSSSLGQNPLAFIEHATGTGKSFILLKYLYSKMRNKRILFITRHYEMLEQLFNDQMETLGLSKDDFAKFDPAIYPNILDMDMEEVIKNYDCIVWDEAHHCGAPKWSIKVNELKELVKKKPGKCMIGATATRIRYLDDYMDVAENFFDGNVVSELPVTRAILKNLLPAPSIIMTGQACLEQIEKLEKKLIKIPQTKEVKEYLNYIENLKEYIIDEFYVGNMLKKYDVKQGEKYIVFCSDINDVKMKMKEAEHWFKDIGPVKMYSAHSAQKRSTNIEQIKSFSEKRKETSLMFAVDIFNEGFHIDGVDGILIFRKTKSPIVYWQQLGRALSFSSRRKQIKIFDFANNTSDNKIVYELYREMLEEAKRLIKEDPENKELYVEILNRFEIIDQTASIFDKLHEIEEKIDQEFIIKSRIDLGILKLEEYRFNYPNQDFNKLLATNQINIDYVRAYNYLCSVEDYLTIEQVERLQKLNIAFTTKINLPKNKRLELLGENKTFKELEEKRLKEFIKTYVDFCNKNNRRPTVEDDEKLYLQYRKYLDELSKHKINKLLAQVPFRLTLEETILLGNYPSRDDINEYIERIKQKIEKNILLDPVELKVLKKLSHVISNKDSQLLEYLSKYADVNYQINNAIETIRKYKNGENILESSSYKKALRIINRYALRITNEQFRLLLELGIQVPKKIDMPMEKRLKELNGFNSFYEKKQNEKNSAINLYIKFLKENKHRPNLNNAKEAKLQKDYEKQIFRTSGRKIKEIASVLSELNIRLSLEEAILSKKDVNIEELEVFIATLHNKLVNNQRVTREELRMLRSIEAKGYQVKTDIASLIKNIVAINMIDDMIASYESGKLNEFQKRNVMKSIFHKSIFFTRHHVEKLKSLNIKVPNEIIEDLNESAGFINRFEYEVKLKETAWTELLDYMRKNNSYPDRNSELMRKYHFYLSNISKSTIKQKTKEIKSLGIDLGIEERLLLKDYNSEDIINYFEIIKRKIKNGEELDQLEVRICHQFNGFDFIKEYIDFIRPKQVGTKPPIESRIIRSIKTQITNNPFAEPDLENNYSLSNISKRKLEVFRINELADRVFSDILKVMKKEKKTLDDILDERLRVFFESAARSKDLNPENKFLLTQVHSYDHTNTLLKKEISIDDFLSEYIAFIQNANGVRPTINSEDESERLLATKYEDIKDILDEKALRSIERAIKDKINEEDIKSFYPRLIEFINSFERFPCGNSDNPDEVHLNVLLQNVGSNLTKEQNNELKKLKKLYGRATVLANIEFAKKRNNQSNK